MPSDYRLTVPMLARGEVEVHGAPVPLSPNEMLLLTALLANRGRIMETSDLIEAVYQDPFAEPDCAENNIKCLIQRLRQKGVAVASECRRGYFIESCHQ